VQILGIFKSGLFQPAPRSRFVRFGKKYHFHRNRILTSGMENAISTSTSPSALPSVCLSPQLFITSERRLGFFVSPHKFRLPIHSLHPFCSSTLCFISILFHRFPTVSPVPPCFANCQQFHNPFATSKCPQCITTRPSYCNGQPTKSGGKAQKVPPPAHPRIQKLGAEKALGATETASSVERGGEGEAETPPSTH